MDTIYESPSLTFNSTHFVADLTIDHISKIGCAWASTLPGTECLVSSRQQACMAPANHRPVTPQGASKSLVQLVTDLGNELKGSSEGKIVSIMEDFEHQIDGLGIKVGAHSRSCMSTSTAYLLSADRVNCILPFVASGH